LAGQIRASAGRVRQLPQADAQREDGAGADRGRDVLLAMLPVRDDVQRAVDAMQKSDDLEALRAGVTLISQKFTEALRQKGVTEIEVLDREFDADLSEAVAKFAAGDEKKGKVIDVVQTGYKLGDKVLRFAKVVVGE